MAAPDKKTAPPKPDPIQEAMKKLGMTPASSAALHRGWIHTGNYALNFVVSGRFSRGWPMGHTVEIGGDNSTGKSYLAARTLSVVQAAGGVALLDDSEGAYNTDWARRLGVDNSTLWYKRSRTVREHYDALRGFIDDVYLKLLGGPGLPGVMVLDSVAMLSTTHERKEGLDKQDMTRAKEIRALFRLVLADISETNLVYLLTNHNISGPGDDAFAYAANTSGGSAPKYAASIRIDLQSIGRLRVEGTSIFTGVKINVIAVKTRQTAPWRRCSMVIPFGQPISHYSGLVPVLMERGIISASTGHKIVYQETDTGIGVNKSDLARQDGSAEELIGRFPGILVEADLALDAQEKVLIEHGVLPPTGPLVETV